MKQELTLHKDEATFVGGVIKMFCIFIVAVPTRAYTYIHLSEFIEYCTYNGCVLFSVSCASIEIITGEESKILTMS